AAPRYIVDQQPSGDVGVEHGNRHRIRSGDERLGNILVLLAEAAESWDLLDFEHGEIELGVAPRVMRQLIRHLLGGGDAEIGKYAAMEPVREVDVEDGPRKIGAIAPQHMEAGPVGPRIQAGDEFVVLLRSSVEAEGIDAALIGRADE